MTRRLRNAYDQISELLQKKEKVDRNYLSGSEGGPGAASACTDWIWRVRYDRGVRTKIRYIGMIEKGAMSLIARPLCDALRAEISATTCITKGF